MPLEADVQCVREALYVNPFTDYNKTTLVVQSAVLLSGPAAVQESLQSDFHPSICSTMY